MYISIGILAHNESQVICGMLRSLFAQSIFREVNSRIEQIEVIVVPNGCSDNTAALAQETLDELTSKQSASLTWQVKELTTPGKSNAWNHYVHSLASVDADYLFLIDSDIEFIEAGTLESMLETLETDPETWVAVDLPVKDVALKQSKSLSEKLSVLASGISGNKAAPGEPAWICGQLYCARAKILRQIWLPLNIINDDSFIYTNIVTEGLTTTVNPHRVIRAKEASHIFEAYTDLARLLRHEKWLIVGSAINELIYQDLQGTSDVALTIKARNETNARWVQELIDKQANHQGWWLIPNFILLRRFISLGQKPIYKALLLSPLVFCAFVVDAWLALRANLELHQGKGLGYWRK